MGGTRLMVKESCRVIRVVGRCFLALERVASRHQERSSSVAVVERASLSERMGMRALGAELEAADT